MEAVFLKLLNMSITASWLVLAVILLRLLLKKAPKGIVCLLWGLVAIRLICPFSLESVWSLVPSVETVPEDIGVMQEPAIHSGVPIINQVVNPVLYESFAPEPMNSANPLQVVTWVASHLWVIGVAVMVLYVTISYWRVYRRVRMFVPLEEGVRVCDEIDTPFILGMFRPYIYLPSSLSEKEIGYVLLHERVHLKRRDYLWKPFAFALLTIYWFNPMLWAAYLLFSRDIELACDERVIQNMDGDHKKAYAATLLRCSVSSKQLPVCPLAFGEVGVKRRVKSMKNYKKPTFWMMFMAVVSMMFLAACFMTDPKDQEENETEATQEETLLPEETDEKETVEESVDEERKIAAMEAEGIVSELSENIYEYAYREVLEYECELVLAEWLTDDAVDNIRRDALSLAAFSDDDERKTFYQGRYTIVDVIESPDELELFVRKQESRFDFDKNFGEYASFKTAAEKWDEARFAEKAMLVVHWGTVSKECRYDITSVKAVTTPMNKGADPLGIENEAILSVNIEETFIPEKLVEEPASWFALIEVDKEVVQAVYEK